MKRGSWKRVESKVAAKFGTVRTPLSGSNSRHTSSDSLRKDLYIEIKCRKAWAIFTLWKDVKAKAKKEKKHPILILHEVGKHSYLRVEETDLKELELE